MTMTSDTEIVPCHDESAEIPTVKYEFSSIKDIEGKEPGTLIGNISLRKKSLRNRRS